MQFTLSRLSASMALIAVGIAGATLPLWCTAEMFDSWPVLVQAIAVMLYPSGGALIGGGIGRLFNRPWLGCAIGFGGTVVVALIVAARVGHLIL